MDIGETPLTMHEKGVSGKPTAYDKLMDSPQWKAAKAKNNPDTDQPFTDKERKDGADFIAETLWARENTDELKKRLEGKDPVFITMPSTTRQNLLPEALAKLLRAEIGGTVISGSEVTTTVHTNAMKEIPAEQRPFVPREYVLNDPVTLRKETTGKAVVIVEDVFSSGASAKAFCDTLKEAKIQVHTVAGLLGDSRLTTEPQLVNKLQKTLKHAGIESVKAKDISAILSRGQITTLIDVVNNTRGKNEQERIAKNLQGIFNSRTARHLGQDLWRSKGGLGNSAGENDRIGSLDARISANTGIQSGGGNDQIQIREQPGNSLKKGDGEKKSGEVTRQHGTQDFQKQRAQTMTATPTEEKKPDFIQNLTTNIMKNIDKGQGLLPNQQLPFNPATGKRYAGANMVALAAENRPQNMWLTYSQIAAAGGKVNKGEKGKNIQIWSTTEKGRNGETIRLDKPKLSYATVFNVEQTTLTDMNAKTPERPMTAQEFLSSFKIRHDMSPTARPRHDATDQTITVPPPNRFPNAETYQRVVVEQVAAMQDALGSRIRDDSKGSEPLTPGTPQAAAHEMKIKMAAAIIGDQLGIGHNADLNNNIYSNHWKKTAQNHPRDILRTAAQAETIAFVAINEAKQAIELNGHLDRKIAEQDQVLYDKERRNVKANGGTGVGDRSAERQNAAEAQPISQRINLHVPFAEKDRAKEAGCRWDRDQKTWYAPPGTDMNKIAQWRENTRIQAKTPREEFMNAMTAKGMIMADNHPIMDGRPHRISVVGDDHAKNERSGFYVAHGDGVPAGYIKNNRTGEESKWRATGYTITDEMKTTLREKAVEKYELREEEITKKQQQVSTRITKNLAKMEAVTEPTTYMQNKGIGVENGVYKTVGKSGEVKLAIPLTDIDGKVWSMSTIAEDGTKSYAKDGKKHGSFHVVGGLDELKKAPAIIMAEGYATAVSLKNGLNTPVVAAMDAGNLTPVAKELRKAFPEKAIVICGDDDRKQLENPQIGKNIGKEKAMEAALAVGGQAVFPIFPKGADNSLSDFNDLATKSGLGMDGLRQQTQPAINRAVNNAKEAVSKTLIAETARQKNNEQARESMGDKEKELKREKEKEQEKAPERQRQQGGRGR